MAIITIGKGGMYSCPYYAAPFVKGGDTVEIFPGTYGGAWFWAPNITIVGMGPGVVIKGALTQGKGLFVLSGQNVTVKNITFDGANNYDGNGAGINFTGTNLTVLNSTFLNNQDGILTSPNKSSTITVKNSTFNGNGSNAGAHGAAHAIYAGAAALLDVENSTFTNTQQGHDIKSRANNTIIKNNSITDGPTGTSSYLIDIPNGGAATITGNFLEKGPRSANYSYAITVGEEGMKNPAGPIVIANNTFVNNDTTKTVFAHNQTGTPDYTVANNTISGLKTTVLTGQGTVTNTPVVSQPFLVGANDFAGAVGLGTSTAGSIKAAGYSDWYVVNLSAGYTYAFDLQGSPSGHGTLNDAYLTLRDASGNEITHNDNAGSPDSQITYTPTTSGIYYLAASSASPSETGTYQISATADTTAHGAPPSGTSKGDFNGDGKSDILWQNASGQAGIWLLNGTTILSAPTVGNNPGTSWKVIGSGDFDGDGKADILWQSTNGQAGIWLMNGTTVLSSPTVGANPGSTWKAVAAADFDGDGKADILWQSTSGQAGIWFMNGTTPLSLTNTGSNPGPSWHVIGAGDFNSDGKADILWQNTSGQAGIWLMNGTTVLSAPTVGSNPGPTWHAICAADFDGDGKSDILWQNDNGQAGIWFMNGTTVLSQTTTGANPGSSWKVVGAADVNGDGKADILWQSTSGQAGVWLMNGNTALSSPNLGTNPGTSWHIAAGTGG